MVKATQEVPLAKPKSLKIQSVGNYCCFHVNPMRTPVSLGWREGGLTDPVGVARTGKRLARHGHTLGQEGSR